MHRALLAQSLALQGPPGDVAVVGGDSRGWLPAVYVAAATVGFASLLLAGVVLYVRKTNRQQRAQAAAAAQQQPLAQQAPAPAKHSVQVPVVIILPDSTLALAFEGHCSSSGGTKKDCDGAAGGGTPLERTDSAMVPEP